MKLFEYAVLYTPAPTSDKPEAKAKARKEARILIPVSYLLADNEEEVKLTAAMSIPKEFKDKLADVHIAIRFF